MTDGQVLALCIALILASCNIGTSIDRVAYKVDQIRTAKP